jgi:hypothetical protein
MSRPSEPADWKVKFEADDGAVYYDAEAIRQSNADFERRGFRGFRRDVGHGPETRDEWARRTSAPRRDGAGAVRCRRAAAPRERRTRAVVRASSRGGDSGDPHLTGDDDPPGPGSGQLDPAERLRTLRAFVAEHGLTYWDGQYGVSR